MNISLFLPDTILLFQKLKLQAESGIDQTDEESFFAFPSVESNSIAILVKHLGGNLRSRWVDFLTSDGEKSDRDRDSEFDIYENDTEESLMAFWEEGWNQLFSTLNTLKPEDLNKSVIIRGEKLSVLQAVLRSLSHTSLHVGQIVYLARQYAGDQWQTLSIERGKSAEYIEKSNT